MHGQGRANYKAHSKSCPGLRHLMSSQTLSLRWTSLLSASAGRPTVSFAGKLTNVFDHRAVQSFSTRGWSGSTRYERKTVSRCHFVRSALNASHASALWIRARRKTMMLNTSVKMIRSSAARKCRMAVTFSKISAVLKIVLIRNMVFITFSVGKPE